MLLRVSLTPTTFMVPIDGTFVILDGYHNKYLTLSPQQNEWMGEIIRTAEIPPHLEQTYAFAKRMIEFGLFKAMGNHESDVERPSIPRAITSLEFLDQEKFAKSRYPYTVILVAFLAAIAISKVNLGLRPFRSVVFGKPAKRNTPTPPHKRLNDAVALTRQFHRLTPLFFSSHDACLYRSLALKTFLGFFGIDTRWVFGVRMSPFKAHCWIELDGVVLNDAFDRTLEYSAILSV